MNLGSSVTKLLNIEYPIIQAGMVWTSGWRLASAVSNCGGLGLIGAGSMKPDLLREHIIKCRQATDKPFGVNIPQLREDAQALIQTALDENVRIFFTSAGSPAKFIDLLKKHNCIVVHVVSSVKFALKAEGAGCDAVVGEGVEAGGHNGIDELSTLCLIPQLVDAVKIPVIAAGGITDGRQALAAFALGAEGVQIGTRFAVTEESSSHPDYKARVCASPDNGTTMALKKIGMVRALRNPFMEEAIKAETMNCEPPEKLKELLGRKREMKGIFEGNWEEGLLEAGQGAGMIKEILPVKSVFENILSEMEAGILKLRG